MIIVQSVDADEATVDGITVTVRYRVTEQITAAQAMQMILALLEDA